MEKKYITLLFISLTLLLGACKESEEPKPDPNDIYRSGEVGMWVNKEVPVSGVFDLVDSYSLPLSELRAFYMNSAFPVDSIPYIQRELQTKPYFENPEMCTTTGFLNEDADQVSVFINCVDLTEDNRIDLLQTIETLQLSDRGTMASQVIVKVEPGTEEAWIQILATNVNVSTAFRVHKY